MVKCKNCGTDLEDGSKFCMACGTPTEDGVPQEETQVVNISLQLGGDGQAKKSGGIKRKIASVKDKTLAFESKHNVILNSVMLLCAVVILFVSLFAPIKVNCYVAVERSGSNIIVENNDEKSAVFSTVEIKQSIWQMIGSVWYVKASDETKKELSSDVLKAMTAAQIAYAAWNASNPGADSIERQNAMAEIIADNISDINYLGYIMATKDDSQIGGEDMPVSISGEYWAAVVSMAFGLLVTLFAVIIALYSLVKIISAVVNIVRKKPQVGLYKYMIKVLTLSGIGMMFMWSAPMLTAGGGMFAVSVFVAVCMLIFAFAGGLISGNTEFFVIVKRAVAALLCMIAFYILCGNIVVSTITDPSGRSTGYNGSAGYGLYSMLAAIDTIIEISGSGGEADTAALISAAHGLIGVIVYLVAAGFVMGYAHKVYARSVKRLAFGEGKSNGNIMMIATVVIMAVAIVLGFMSNTFETMFIEKLFRGSVSGYKGEWMMRGQVWTSMILILLAVIFNKAFDPEFIRSKIDERKSAARVGANTAENGPSSENVQPDMQPDSVSDAGADDTDPFGL